MKEKVKKTFYSLIKNNMKIPPDLRSALLQKHPNVEKYLILLTKEIEKVQAHGLKKRGKVYEWKHIEDLISDMTNVFVKRLMFEAQKMYESDLARLERERKIQEQKDIEATVDGKPQGIFAEMGVISNEKAVGQRQEEKV